MSEFNTPNPRRYEISHRFLKGPGQPGRVISASDLFIAILIPDRSKRLPWSPSSVYEEFSIDIQKSPRSKTAQTIKRVFDLVIAGISLIILAPLLIASAAAIKLDSSGPVIFAQRRKGLNGKTFSIYKFRTMNVMEDGPSVIQAMKYDARVTRVGRLLRRTSIDELPQLFNVLIGDMSIVGPRPHATAHDEQYSGLITGYKLRHQVKPGITGWAQVHGFRGETSTLEKMMKRLQYDLWYINNWNILLDFWILARTGAVVLQGVNAY